LRYLKDKKTKSIIQGAVLVSGPCEKNGNNKIDNFLDKDFDYKIIKSRCKVFSIIHGDNDPNVPLDNAKTLAKELYGELIIVKNGGHLNGSSGYTSLPQCLKSLEKMMN